MTYIKKWLACVILFDDCLFIWQLFNKGSTILGIQQSSRLVGIGCVNLWNGSWLPTVLCRPTNSDLWEDCFRKGTYFYPLLIRCLKDNDDYFLSHCLYIVYCDVGQWTGRRESKIRICSTQQMSFKNFY